MILNIAKSILLAIVGAVFIAYAAQITVNIPLEEGGIPVTGQSFAVLLFAFTFHSRIGVAAVALYLLAGIAGLEVFADGGSGFDTIKSHSGGYLYGFLIGAYLVGLFAEVKWDRNIFKSIIAMTIGTAIILVIGLIHLILFVGVAWADAFDMGFYPLLKGAGIKILLAAWVWPFYYFLNWYTERRYLKGVAKTANS